MAYQCRLCLPRVSTFANDGNMKSHLGAANLPGHNMGPWRCLHPGCTTRSVRKYVMLGHDLQSFLANDHRSAPNVNHGNHTAVWFRDPALVALRNAEAARCRLPWAPVPVVPPPPAVAAAVVQAPVVAPPVVAPPVVAQGPPAAAPGLALMAPLAGAPLAHSLPGAAQGPPVVAQIPAVAGPAAQVPAVHVPASVGHAPAPGPLVSTAASRISAAAAGGGPPPTNYFGPQMDDFERRHAGKTREDIEEQYIEGMWLFSEGISLLLTM